MTFDSTQPYKMVDGVNINLTAEEIADIAAARAAYVPPPPPVPDLATQLAAALINNGVIQPTDINSDTLTTINQSLEAAKLSTIAVSAQPVKLA